MGQAEENFATRYAAMDEQQLMDVARQYDTLVGDAQHALRAEFARRGLEPPLIEDPADPSSYREMVTIASYRDPSEAWIPQTLLESAGISVFLRDENTVRLDWGVSNAIGGIRLQVDRKNAEAAMKLLHESAPAEIVYDEDEEPYLQPACPVCHSEDISFGMEAHLWQCHACDARWSDTEDDDLPEDEE